MEMIIGGAWQGKTAFVRSRYPRICFLDGAQITEEELMNAEGVLNLHAYIRKELAAGHETGGLAEKLCGKNPDLVMTVQELGCGVVPMDPFERKYRETAGRICTELAACSTTVIRVMAGIPVALKGDI